MIDNPLHARRAELGLTQAQMASLCHVSVVTVNAWECSRIAPQVTRIPDICAAYQVSIQQARQWVIDLIARAAARRAA